MIKMGSEVRINTRGTVVGFKDGLCIVSILHQIPIAELREILPASPPLEEGLDNGLAIGDTVVIKYALGGYTRGEMLDVVANGAGVLIRELDSGAEMLVSASAVHPLKETHQVESETDDSLTYDVTRFAEYWFCTCPDFKYRNPEGPPTHQCKHIKKVLEERE